MKTSKLANAMVNVENRTGVTDNGAVSFRSTLSSTVDFFSKVAACRAREEKAIDLFNGAFKEDAEVAMRTLFYSRDIRGGQGERDIFRAILSKLVEDKPELVKKNFANIVEYGRWDDLFIMFGTVLEDDMVEFVCDQLNKDLDAERPSLLGKWMPSINTSSSKTVAMAKKFAKAIGVSEKDYRKTLSKLRKTIDVLERKLTTRDYAAIDYSKIPSRAGFKYRKAFKRNDEVNYNNFLNKVNSGEVKINTSGLYPYDIARSVYSGASNDEKALDVMWNNLPDFMEGNERNSLVMADVSASMIDGNNGASVAPIHVSTSLAVYIAERNKGAFKDLFMTFSEQPEIVKVRGTTVVEKFKNIRNSNWGYSTDLQASFQNILRLAQENNVPQDEMPEVIYIISDMQFNRAAKYDKTNYEAIQHQYKLLGYELPKIVFWNVDAKANESPVVFDEKGVALVSGCSPSILKTLLGGTSFTPIDIMLETVMSDRYSKVFWE
jgi:Domain of unknown function (DUF2828)